MEGKERGCVQSIEGIPAAEGKGGAVVCRGGKKRAGVGGGRDPKQAERERKSVEVC